MFMPRTDREKCQFVVNPKVAFLVPDHLILHEAAHHIAMAKEWNSHWADSGHCAHWANILLEIYHKTGVKLPRGTQFENFAKIANIRWWYNDHSYKLL